MDHQTDSAWLEDFLPLMRCPDTAMKLRRATAEECAAQRAVDGLVREDGGGFFPIDDGIPILLPKDSQQM